MSVGRSVGPCQRVSRSVNCFKSTCTEYVWVEYAIMCLLHIMHDNVLDVIAALYVKCRSVSQSVMSYNAIYNA
jgi:hypothetical protein